MVLTCIMGHNISFYMDVGVSECVCVCVCVCVGGGRGGQIRSTPGLLSMALTECEISLN